MTPPRVGIVGPLLGGQPGWVESPGLALAEHLEAEGTVVRTTSRAPGRVRRTAEVGTAGLRWWRSVDVAVVMVFSGAAFALSTLGLRSTSLTGARPVAWLHGGGLPELASRRPAAVRRLLQRGPVVAPSPWLAEWARGLGADATVIPNVVAAPTAFRHRSNLAPRLLWMRTYHPLYDPLLAVEAFEHVLRHRPDATLTMAGQDRGLAATVRATVAERGLEHAVEVRGFFDRAAKAEAFADHDLFLSTNVVDNAPVTLVEAGAAGLPVVALAVGGVPSLLEGGRGGRLVHQRTPEAVAGAVLDLLADPDAAGRLSDAGLARAAQHRWDAVGPRWHALLEATARG